MSSNFKLTALSHGGGCGCKISPKILDKLLKSIPTLSDPQMLLGCNTSDDAALYRLDSERVLIATTDFFMPIVDDPFDFGSIAAANALSDVYAMGGKAILALNILGMPTDKVPLEAIERILAGGRDACDRGSVSVVGGHSIDSNEPFYGLSVCGLGHPNRIKRNSTAQLGDVLVLGKPLGIGVLAAAYKQGKLNSLGYKTLITHACQLNDVGIELAKLKSVHAMTDITGFGLLGHLLEICRASQLHAVLETKSIPLIDDAVDLVANGITVGAAARNQEYYQSDVDLSDQAKNIQTLLSDPQSNGGLLVSCALEIARKVQDLFVQNGFKQASIIGRLDHRDSGKVTVV